MSQLQLAFAVSGSVVAGVDEAGRGPLAGPVFAAAVILDDDRRIDGLADSKMLPADTRQRLAEKIRQSAVAVAVAFADNLEIDEVNILNATMLAMQRAVSRLSARPDLVLVDGNRCPDLPCRVHAIVRGDQSVAAISAASIVAKVARDEEMQRMDMIYPGYGFARHKGYPTRMHLRALHELGICPIHRQSYAPVRRVMGDDAACRNG